MTHDACLEGGGEMEEYSRQGEKHRPGPCGDEVTQLGLVKWNTRMPGPVGLGEQVGPSSESCACQVSESPLCTVGRGSGNREVII